MVSDFVDEHNGFLALTDEEYEQAKQTNPSVKNYARQFLEYGESKEGYWTRDKCIGQIKRAVEIAEIKYPKTQGWRHVWVFDHSSCHAAMADDALDASKMNVNPDGKSDAGHCVAGPSSDHELCLGCTKRDAGDTPRERSQYFQEGRRPNEGNLGGNGRLQG